MLVAVRTLDEGHSIEHLTGLCSDASNKTSPGAAEQLCFSTCLTNSGK